jgi:glycosyltransferase involved in cell wall biosynthesis
VSVIVPVLDGSAHVERCLAALQVQSHPAAWLEVIVVDNGSRDDTRRRVRQHRVTLLVESGRRSPYAARNAGIRAASGEVLAFTDSDCVPAKDWVERGLAALEREGADLVAGHVRFGFGGTPSAAQLMDAITNLDQQGSVAARGVAKTGNLFVKRRVFDELGPFDSRRRSGGDVEFTARATGAGFCLVYAGDAVGEKPARRVFALARKQYRVGRGQVASAHGRGARRAVALREILARFRPARPRVVRESLARRGPAGSEARTWAVWATSWLINVIHGLGMLHAWLDGGRRRP